MSHRSHTPIITIKGAGPIFYDDAGKFNPCSGKELEIRSSY